MSVGVLMVAVSLASSWRMWCEPRLGRYAHSSCDTVVDADRGMYRSLCTGFD